MVINGQMKYFQRFLGEDSVYFYYFLICSDFTLCNICVFTNNEGYNEVFS